MRATLRLLAWVVVLAGAAAAQDGAADPAPVPPPAAQDVAPAEQEEPTAAVAVTDADEAVGIDISDEAVAARIAALEADDALDDSDRELLVGLWQQVQSQLRAAASSVESASAYRLASEGAAAQVAESQAELAALPPADSSVDLSDVIDVDAHPGSLDLAELQAALGSLEDIQAAADDVVVRLASERTLRASRRREIPGEIGVLREQIAVLQVAEPPLDDPAETQARRALRQAQIVEKQARIASLEVESRSYEDRRELLTVRQDLALRRQALARARTAALRTLVDAARIARREQEARVAELEVRALRDSHPLIQQIAARDAELSRLGVELASAQSETSARQAAVAAESERIRGQRQLIDDKIKKLGFTNVLGLLLRRYREELPDPEAFRSSADEAEFTRIEQVVLQLEDEREEFTDLDSWVAAKVRDVDPEPFYPDRASLAADLQARVSSYRSRLDSTIGQAEARFEQLVNLDGEQQLLTDRVEAYDLFIGERILWVPDGDVISLADLAQVPGSLRWLITGESVQPLIDAARHSYEERPRRDSVLVGLLVLFLLARPLIRRRMHRLSEAACAPDATIVPTLRALFYTMLSTLVLPAVIWAVGWRLELQPRVSSLGLALQELSTALVPFTLLSAMAARGGLGEAHFGWPQTATARIRRATRWVAFFALPSIFVGMLVESAADPELDRTLGRLSRVVGMLAVTGYLHAILCSGGPIAQILAATRRSQPKVSLLPFCHLVALLIPASLVALILLGFGYAEQVVTRSLLSSALLVGTMILVRGLSLRSIVLVGRRVAFRQLSLPEDPGEDDEAQAELRATDIDHFDLQARHLLRLGLFLVSIASIYLIWEEVLPALRVLDRIELWERAEPITSVGQDGVTQLLSAFVTAQDVIISLLVITLTVVAVRNVPGLIGIVLLSRLPILPGTAYAVKSLIGYTLMFAGLLWAVGNIGLDWDRLQWLVASMGVGLGFGLQEVFANFISGVILLFERPVRVGDVVSVGTTKGVVSQIKMRSTTVRDYNRREVLIPNRRFITEEVTNWTLSDAISRLVFPVYVEPGSDKDLVARLLLEVAEAQAGIIDDPAPSVVCRGYDRGALWFDLRVFIPSFDEWVAVTNGVNVGIDNALSREGLRVLPPQTGIQVQELGGGLGRQGREITRPPGSVGDGSSPDPGASGAASGRGPTPPPPAPDPA